VTELAETTQGNEGNGTEQPHRARSSTERSRAHRARKKLEREAALQKAEAERVAEAPATETAAAGDVAGDVASSRNTVAGAAPGSAEQKEEREAAALHEAGEVECEAGATETATIERVAGRVADVAEAVAFENAVASVVASSSSDNAVTPLQPPQWRILPRVERPVGLPVVLAGLQWMFGGLSILLSFVVGGISMLLNMTFWSGLDPNHKDILAIAGLVVEFINFVVPSAISLAPPQLAPPQLVRPVRIIWFVTVAMTAVAAASFLRESLGASEVARQTNISERDRLQGIVNSVVAPISDASVVATREKRDTAKAVARSDCPKNKSLDIELCNKSKAAWKEAEDDLTRTTKEHDAAVADAKREHQSRVDKAKADLKDLPVISTDKNVVLAGVAAIMPWVPEAWVNGIVAAFWVLLFTFGPPTLLKFGLESAAPPRTT
jgi:hypothetical protein